MLKHESDQPPASMPEGAFPKEEKKKTPALTPEEEILETSEPENRSPLRGGSNESVLVKLKDDGSGVFKPRDGECDGLRDKVKAGTYFKRERAAYLVDRFLGFGLTPPTTVRDIEGETGSIQQFIPDAKSIYEFQMEEILKYPSLKMGLMRLWIFDYIIYNSDRHRGNLLIKGDRVYAIDNGLTFGNDYLSTCQNFYNEPIPEEIKETIVKFLSYKEGKEILKDLLLELLPQEEVEACFKRMERVGEFITLGKISFDDKLTF